MREIRYRVFISSDGSSWESKTSEPKKKKLADTLKRYYENKGFLTKLEKIIRTKK